MNIIKKTGFVMQFLWLPLLSYALALTIYAMLIPKGLTGFDWPSWRLALAVTVVFVVIMAMQLSDRNRDEAVFAACTSVVPWVCLAAIWFIKLYFSWEFSWPPADWFLMAFIGTYALPFFCGVVSCSSPFN